MLTAMSTPRRFARSLLHFGVTIALVAGCSKKSPEMTSANAAPAKEHGSGAKAGSKPDETPPPGVDLSKLDEFERKVFFRVINKEASACGKGQSLAQSLKSDRACRKSLYATRYVARLVDGGYTDSEIGEKLAQRYRTGAPKAIDLAESPWKGNANAPVTLVEFVDYQCPMCARVQPALRQVLEEYPNEVKLHFKHYPLPSHTYARAASEAATAAHRQGKFWAYSDRIWPVADSLTPATLEQIAREAGLDVERWRKDFESPEVKERVSKDRSEGAALGVQATPTLFINGRRFNDAVEPENLRDVINEELNR
jgi:protein-disulfide isomerase